MSFWKTARGSRCSSAATSAAASASNPKYTMTGVLPTYAPLSGDVGTVSMVDAQFQNADPSGIVRSFT